MTSCKDGEKKTDTVDAKTENPDDGRLKVSFDLTIKKDDNLHLYFTEDGTINFNEQQSVWLPVKGSDASQKVTFVLPEEVVPTHIRVDFGHGKNPAQSDVALTSFGLSYLGQDFQAQGTDIFKYFYPSAETTKIVEGTATLQRLKSAQESAPILYPQIPLTEKLKELAQGTPAN